MPLTGGTRAHRASLARFDALEQGYFDDDVRRALEATNNEIDANGAPLERREATVHTYGPLLRGLGLSAPQQTTADLHDCCCCSRRGEDAGPTLLDATLQPDGTVRIVDLPDAVVQARRRLVTRTWCSAARRAAGAADLPGEHYMCEEHVKLLIAQSQYLRLPIKVRDWLLRGCCLECAFVCAGEKLPSPGPSPGTSSSDPSSSDTSSSGWSLLPRLTEAQAEELRASLAPMMELLLYPPGFTEQELADAPFGNSVPVLRSEEEEEPGGDGVEGGGGDMDVEQEPGEEEGGTRAKLVSLPLRARNWCFECGCNPAVYIFRARGDFTSDRVLCPSCGVAHRDARAAAAAAAQQWKGAPTPTGSGAAAVVTAAATAAAGAVPDPTDLVLYCCLRPEMLLRLQVMFPRRAATAAAATLSPDGEEGEEEEDQATAPAAVPRSPPRRQQQQQQPQQRLQAQQQPQQQQPQEQQPQQSGPASEMLLARPEDPVATEELPPPPPRRPPPTPPPAPTLPAAGAPAARRAGAGSGVNLGAGGGPKDGGCAGDGSRGRVFGAGLQPLPAAGAEAEMGPTTAGAALGQHYDTALAAALHPAPGTLHPPQVLSPPAPSVQHQPAPMVLPCSNHAASHRHRILERSQQQQKKKKHASLQQAEHHHHQGRHQGWHLSQQQCGGQGKDRGPSYAAWELYQRAMAASGQQAQHWGCSTPSQQPQPQQLALPGTGMMTAAAQQPQQGTYTQFQYHQYWQQQQQQTWQSGASQALLQAPAAQLQQHASSSRPWLGETGRCFRGGGAGAGGACGGGGGGGGAAQLQKELDQMVADPAAYLASTSGGHPQPYSYDYSYPYGYSYPSQPQQQAVQGTASAAATWGHQYPSEAYGGGGGMYGGYAWPAVPPGAGPLLRLPGSELGGAPGPPAPGSAAASMSGPGCTQQAAATGWQQPGTVEGWPAHRARRRSRDGEWRGNDTLQRAAAAGAGAVGVEAARVRLGGGGGRRESGGRGTGNAGGCGDSGGGVTPAAARQVLERPAAPAVPRAGEVPRMAPATADGTTQGGGRGRSTEAPGGSRCGAEAAGGARGGTIPSAAASAAAAAAAAVAAVAVTATATISSARPATAAAVPRPGPARPAAATAPEPVPARKAEVAAAAVAAPAAAPPTPPRDELFPSCSRPELATPRYNNRIRLPGRHMACQLGLPPPPPVPDVARRDWHDASAVVEEVPYFEGALARCLPHLKPQAAPRAGGGAGAAGPPAPRVREEDCCYLVRKEALLRLSERKRRQLLLLTRDHNGRGGPVLFCGPTGLVNDPTDILGDILAATRACEVGFRSFKDLKQQDGSNLAGGNGGGGNGDAHLEGPYPWTVGGHEWKNPVPVGLGDDVADAPPAGPDGCAVAASAAAAAARDGSGRAAASGSAAAAAAAPPPRRDHFYGPVQLCCMDMAHRYEHELGTTPVSAVFKASHGKHAPEGEVDHAHPVTPAQLLSYMRSMLDNYAVVTDPRVIQVREQCAVLRPRTASASGSALWPVPAAADPADKAKLLAMPSSAPSAPAHVLAAVAAAAVAAAARKRSAAAAGLPQLGGGSAAAAAPAPKRAAPRPPRAPHPRASGAVAAGADGDGEDTEGEEAGGSAAAAAPGGGGGGHVRIPVGLKVPVYPLTADDTLYMTSGDLMRLAHRTLMLHAPPWLRDVLHERHNDALDFGTCSRPTDGGLGVFAHFCNMLRRPALAVDLATISHVDRSQPATLMSFAAPFAVPANLNSALQRLRKALPAGAALWLQTRSLQDQWRLQHPAAAATAAAAAGAGSGAEPILNGGADRIAKRGSVWVIVPGCRLHQLAQAYNKTTKRAWPRNHNGFFTVRYGRDLDALIAACWRSGVPFHVSYHCEGDLLLPGMGAAHSVMPLHCASMKISQDFLAPTGPALRLLWEIDALRQEHHLTWAARRAKELKVEPPKRAITVAAAPAVAAAAAAAPAPAPAPAVGRVRERERGRRHEERAEAPEREAAEDEGAAAGAEAEVGALVGQAAAAGAPGQQQQGQETQEEEAPLQPPPQQQEEERQAPQRNHGQSQGRGGPQEEWEVEQQPGEVELAFAPAAQAIGDSVPAQELEAAASAAEVAAEAEPAAAEATAAEAAAASAAVAAATSEAAQATMATVMEATAAADAGPAMQAAAASPSDVTAQGGAVVAAATAAAYPTEAGGAVGGIPPRQSGEPAPSQGAAQVTLEPETGTATVTTVAAAACRCRTVVERVAATCRKQPCRAPEPAKVGFSPVMAGLLGSYLNSDSDSEAEQEVEEGSGGGGPCNHCASAVRLTAGAAAPGGGAEAPTAAAVASAEHAPAEAIAASRFQAGDACGGAPTAAAAAKASAGTLAIATCAAAASDKARAEATAATAAAAPAAAAVADVTSAAADTSGGSDSGDLHRGGPVAAAAEAPGTNAEAEVRPQTLATALAAAVAVTVTALRAFKNGSGSGGAGAPEGSGSGCSIGSAAGEGCRPSDVSRDAQAEGGAAGSAKVAAAADTTAAFAAMEADAAAVGALVVANLPVASPAASGTAQEGCDGLTGIEPRFPITAGADLTGAPMEWAAPGVDGGSGGGDASPATAGSGPNPAREPDSTLDPARPAQGGEQPLALAIVPMDRAVTAAAAAAEDEREAALALVTAAGTGPVMPAEEAQSVVLPSLTSSTVADYEHLTSERDQGAQALATLVQLSLAPPVGPQLQDKGAFEEAMESLQSLLPNRTRSFQQMLGVAAASPAPLALPAPTSAPASPAQLETAAGWPAAPLLLPAAAEPLQPDSWLGPSPAEEDPEAAPPPQPLLLQHTGNDGSEQLASPEPEAEPARRVTRASRQRQVRQPQKPPVQPPARAAADQQLSSAGAQAAAEPGPSAAPAASHRGAGVAGAGGDADADDLEDVPLSLAVFALGIRGAASASAARARAGAVAAPKRAKKGAAVAALPAAGAGGAPPPRGLRLEVERLLATPAALGLLDAQQQRHKRAPQEGQGAAAKKVRGGVAAAAPPLPPPAKPPAPAKQLASNSERAQVAPAAPAMGMPMGMGMGMSMDSELSPDNALAINNARDAFLTQSILVGLALNVSYTRCHQELLRLRRERAEAAAAAAAAPVLALPPP